MADFPGKIAGAVGDAAKGIGKQIVSEAQRVPKDIAADVLETATGGVVDIGEKKEVELTPAQKQEMEMKKRREAARLQEVQGQLQQVVAQSKQREAQRLQAQEQQAQQSKQIETTKKKSLKDRVVGMFMRKATSKEGEKVKK